MRDVTFFEFLGTGAVLDNSRQRSFREGILRTGTGGGRIISASLFEILVGMLDRNFVIGLRYCSIAWILTVMPLMLFKLAEWSRNSRSLVIVRESKS
jgi:hypothetical protein